MLLMLAALAGGREDLESALLARSLGDHVGSATLLVNVVRTAAADDPSRAWALFWLATERAEQGDAPGAREALRECIRTGPARAECVALLGRLEVEASAITTVPTIWTFDGDHGVVHWWLQNDRGSIRVEDRDGDPALVWVTEHDELDPGTLVIGVDTPRPLPRKLRASLLAPGRNAWLAVVFVDADGKLFGQSPIALPAGRPVELELPLERATGPTGTLDPSRLEMVIVRDMTAKSDPSGGSSLLVIDDIGLE